MQLVIGLLGLFLMAIGFMSGIAGRDAGGTIIAAVLFSGGLVAFALAFVHHHLVAVRAALDKIAANNAGR